MAGSWLLFGARLSQVPKTGHKGFLIPHCRCLQSNPAPLWTIVPPFIIIIITNTGSGGFHCAQTLDWTGGFAKFFFASAQSSVQPAQCASNLKFWEYLRLLLDIELNYMDSIPTTVFSSLFFFHNSILIIIINSSINVHHQHYWLTKFIEIPLI